MSQATDSPSWSAPKTEFEELLDSSFVRDTTTPDSVSHSKADRMLRLTTTDLLFKRIRPDFDKRDLDFLCDLVCANLGRHLDLPVLPQYPVEHPNTHTTTVVDILRERRRNIDQIISSKFQ